MVTDGGGADLGSCRSEFANVGSTMDESRVGILSVNQPTQAQVEGVAMLSREAVTGVHLDRGADPMVASADHKAEVSAEASAQVVAVVSAADLIALIRTPTALTVLAPLGTDLGSEAHDAGAAVSAAHVNARAIAVNCCDVVRARAARERAKVTVHPSVSCTS